MRIDPSLCLTGFLLALVNLAVPAWPHPMGNFSIGHYSRLRVTQGALHLRYVIDMAEIPSFQEMPQLDTDGNHEVSPAEKKNYLEGKVRELAGRLTARLNGKSLDWRIEALDLTGLSETPASTPRPAFPTLHIIADLRADLPTNLPEENRVFYEDKNFPERAGWKEIVVEAGEGVSLLASSAPLKDVSAELTRYPSDPLAAPPQNVAAEFTFALGEGAGNSVASLSTLSSSARQRVYLWLGVILAAVSLIWRARHLRSTKHETPHTQSNEAKK